MFEIYQLRIIILDIQTIGIIEFYQVIEFQHRTLNHNH